MGIITTLYYIMKTRNGIYYDLNYSKYIFNVPDTNIKFVFSSMLYMTKFKEQYLLNREQQNIKFKARYKLNIDAVILPDIMLYNKIEKRGFLIINERGQKLCRENLILNGEKVMRKN